MKFRFVYMLILGMLVLFIASLSLAMGEKPGVKSTPKERDLALDFTLPDLEGHKVSLSDYKGKIVFLNFWATWCPPCRQEMPSMQTLYEKLKGEDFEMLAVSIDKPGKSVVKPFVEKRGYTFKTLLDPKGKVASQYRIVSIPTTFIIDKDGKIIDKVIGAKDWSRDSVIQKFKRLIEK